MKKSLFAVTAIITCSHAIAQRNNSDTTKSPLEEVVVTANKYPKKQSETGKVVTVVNRTMLDNMGGRNLNEILNLVAGTTIIGANANLGTNQTVSIRGAAAGNALVLVDGIPVNDPSAISNYFDLNFFNTAQIERIEVLKGGQSTLYGSDAVAGVINIITRKPEAGKARPYAALSYGSYQTINAAAGLTGGSRTVQYNVMGSTVTSRGFSAAQDTTGNRDFDRDGYRQYQLQGDLNFRLSNRLQLNIFNNYSYYKTDLDAAAFKDDKDFVLTTKNWQSGAGLNWTHGEGNLRFNYRYNYVNRFYFDDSISRGGFATYATGRYTGRTHYAELFESFRWKHVELLVGIDYRRFATAQRYLSISSFGPYETELDGSLARMSQWSPYASVVYKRGGFNVELGGRWNSHSTYGDNFTYTFNPSYLLNQSLKLFANASSAFKTPTLYQLFDLGIGNPNLQAEKTTVLEGGVEWLGSNGLRARATAFHRNTKNAIQYVIIDPSTYRASYVNTDRVKNSGGELELWYNTRKWNVYTAYTYTKGSVTTKYDASGFVKTNDTSYNNLYRVPVHAISSSIHYTVNKNWVVGTLVKYVGERQEPVYNAAPKPLTSYVTIDLSGQYHFNQQIRAFADLRNITNAAYFDVLGYNNRRFNFTVGLAVRL